MFIAFFLIFSPLSLELYRLCMAELLVVLTVYRLKPTVFVKSFPIIVLIRLHYLTNAQYLSYFYVFDPNRFVATPLRVWRHVYF